MSEQEKSYMVLPKTGGFNYARQDFLEYDTIELTDQKACALAGKIMRVTFTSEPESASDNRTIKPGRPLAFWLELERLRAKRERGVYVDPELLSSRTGLLIEIQEIRHSIAELRDQRVDAMHTSQLMRIDAEHDELEKRLAVAKQVLQNVENKLDSIVKEWHSLEAAIAHTETQLTGWNKVPASMQTESQYADKDKERRARAEAETDNCILDLVDYERSLKTASAFFRNDFEKRAQVARERLDDALKKEEQI